MYDNARIVCPVCNADHFTLKYQATYEYSYRIDENAPGVNNTDDFLPYMYDKREQKNANQYIKCNICGTNYPCSFDKWPEGINSKMIQEAIISAYISQQ